MTNHFLSKTKIPATLPPKMLEVIEELKKSPSQEECLRKAYEVMIKRFRGYHLRTFTNIRKIFSFDAEKLWEKPGFIHCHNANYLMRILLIKSGFFKNEDIQNKWTLVWYISPHQYLRIKMNDGRHINIDIWGAANGAKFGEYAHGFH